jgi:hypothetical protein
MRYYIVTLSLSLVTGLFSEEPQEITVRGPIEAIKQEFAGEEEKHTLTLKGYHEEILKPDHFVLHGTIYSRGKLYKEAEAFNSNRIAEVKHMTSEIGGIEYIERNAINFAKGELAVSELKELELKTGFQLKSTSLEKLEAILLKLSTVRGVIINDIVTSAETSANQQRAGLRAAIADLKQNQTLLEESLGLKLRLIKITAIKTPAPIRRSLDPGDEEVIELTPFEVTSARKRYEKAPKLALNKTVFEHHATYSITGLFELVMK